jgi:hypothetical protein
VLPTFKPVISCLIHRVWQNAKRRLQTLMDRRTRLAGDYQRAYASESTSFTVLVILIFPTAAQARPSASHLREAAKCLRSWKDVAEVTGELSAVEFQRMAQDLEQLWEQVGFRRKANGEGMWGLKIMRSRSADNPPS